MLDKITRGDKVFRLYFDTEYLLIWFINLCIHWQFHAGI